MFRYNYLLCTQPIYEKYAVRKYIYLDDMIHSYEDNRFTKNQVHKLLKNIDNLQYTILENNTLPHFVNDTKLKGIKI